MPTDTVSIETFIKANRITLTSEHSSRNPLMENSDSMDNYKVTLRMGRARMTLHFSKGIGHHGANPETAEVLDCLASDAAAIENAGSFEDWCSDYGFDSDSRKAEKTYRACEHQATRLRNLLGDDLYQQLLWNSERL